MRLHDAIYSTFSRALASMITLAPRWRCFDIRALRRVKFRHGLLDVVRKSHRRLYFITGDIISLRRLPSLQVMAGAFSIQVAAGLFRIYGFEVGGNYGAADALSYFTMTDARGLSLRLRHFR